MVGVSEAVVALDIQRPPTVFHDLCKITLKYISKDNGNQLAQNVPGKKWLPVTIDDLVIMYVALAYLESLEGLDSFDLFICLYMSLVHHHRIGILSEIVIIEFYSTTLW